MKQLIYRSRPFGFDQSVLDGILMVARRKNRERGITGALICRRDMYMQLLEGPDDVVDALYDRIRTDDRHVEVTLEAAAPIEARLFPGWDMYADTNPSMTFSREEIENSAIERASGDDLRDLFRVIAEKIRSHPEGTFTRL